MTEFDCFQCHPATSNPNWTSAVRADGRCGGRYTIRASAAQDRAGVYSGFGPQARAALEIAIEEGVIRDAGQYIVTYAFSDGGTSAALLEVEEVQTPNLRVKA